MFRSAGFLEHGRVCPDPLLQALAEQGVDASYHRSYLIDEASLAAADLVLTMEGEHVRKATLLRSSAFEKIVPLKEAAQEVRRLGPGPLAVEDVLEAVGANRDEFVIVRKMSKGDWLERPRTDAAGMRGAAE